MADESNILIGRQFNSAGFLNESNTTLQDYLLDVIRKISDTVYMVDSKTNKQLILSELVIQGYTLAAELKNLGSERGTVVGIISENRLEFPVVLLATILTGATFTCFNPAYSVAELRHVLGITQPTIVFCSSPNYGKLRKINKLMTCVERIILFDTEIEIKTETTLLFSNLMKLPSNRIIYDKSVNLPDDTALILYSSGTTGLPKGVKLSHRNVVFCLKTVKDENTFGFVGNITINVLPMFHGFGLFVILQSILLGHTLVIMDRFQNNSFLSLIQQYKVRFLYLVPTLVLYLLKSAEVDQYNLTSVEQIFSGGAILLPKIETAIRQKLNLKYVQQLYGMTEMTYLLAIKSKGSWKSGTVGCTVPGIKIKITDVETGNILGVGKMGEICAKGPSVMKGYHENEEETAKIIDKNGWLHTGDLGYYDADGELFLVDRCKDLIKYKSLQIAPAALEAILRQHPSVYDAAVVGIPDEITGEVPKAFVVKQEGLDVTEEHLIQYVTEIVSPQNVLRGGVTFIEEIPKNAIGKVLKRKLRENFL